MKMEEGELFVFQKLVENGWKLPAIREGIDWIIEKNGRKIKIQVKTCLPKKIRFNISKKIFDYLFVTDLKDVWVIPIELLNNTEKGTLHKTKGHYELLDKEGLALLSKINDCGIRYGEIGSTTPFFNPTSKSNRRGGVMQEVLSECQSPIGEVA